MNNIGIAVALYVLTSFVSLAVWAINAKIAAAARDAAAAQREAALKQQNELLQLEARLAKEILAPAIDELRAMVRHVEEQLHLRDEVRSGFKGVHAAIRERGATLVPPSQPR